MCLFRIKRDPPVVGIDDAQSQHVDAVHITREAQRVMAAVQHLVLRAQLRKRRSRVLPHEARSVVLCARNENLILFGQEITGKRKASSRGQRKSHAPVTGDSGHSSSCEVVTRILVGVHKGRGKE